LLVADGCTVVIEIRPALLFRPNSVPCGPRNISTCRIP
jgi:hypothetical protein